MASQPFVRRYNHTTDLDAAIHIFRETCSLPLRREPQWTIGSYIWCMPYLLIAPSHCFVLDDGDGKAVGYVIGTPNNKRFVDDYRNRYLPTLDRNVLPEPGTGLEGDEKREGEELLKVVYEPEKALLHSKWPRLLEAYPGHLHIDILPSHQGKGYGQALISTFLEDMRQSGAEGIHLGMDATNHGGRRFYERLGFRPFREVMDEGASGEIGLNGGTLWLCRKL